MSTGVAAEAAVRWRLCILLFLLVGGSAVIGSVRGAGCTSISRSHLLVSYRPLARDLTIGAAPWLTPPTGWS